MKLRVVICSLLVLLAVMALWADTLVVAGHERQLAAPLLIEGDEVLAPVVSSLHLLGAGVTVADGAVAITMPTGKVLRLTAGSPQGQIDTRKIKLSAAPRLVDGELYLPVRSLAPWVNAEARYDAAKKILTLQPLLTVSYITRTTDVAVLVRCSAPLQFTSGRMYNPPRFYLDFKNVSLGLAEQQVPVEAGGIQRLRLSQYSVSPSVVRLVIDASDAALPATARLVLDTQVSEEGRLVTIALCEPKPAAPSAPVPAGPYKITGISLTPCKDQLTEVSITADGPLEVSSDFNSRARQLTLTIPNALQAMPQEQLGAVNDKVVTRIEATGSAETPGVKLVMTLKQESGYLVNASTMGVSILVGAFSLADMCIVLDAGHGGSAPGAIGYNGTLEKDINLDVVLRTARLLQATGATVHLTRTTDTDVSLDARPALANGLNADVFISVHNNSSATRNSLSGTQTYYTTPQSVALASAIHAELLKGLELKNGGIRTANFLVTRKSTMPAVLLELAFINNSTEEKLLCSAEFRQKAAQSIVNGLRRYAATRTWQMRRGDIGVIVAAGG
ncbi:MAG: N-acetylmuramoyl-L-alanine amidase [Armatimonadota bacterium]